TAGLGCKKSSDAEKPGAAGGAATDEKVTIALSCGSVGKEVELCKKGGDAGAAKTGNTIKYVSTPPSPTEALALYQQHLAPGATDIDVFQVDVIWPGILGDFFVDLAPYTKGLEKEHFPAIVANNTRNGKLVAMPWFTDAGILYFRKDLLDKHGEKVP